MRVSRRGPDGRAANGLVLDTPRRADPEVRALAIDGKRVGARHRVAGAELLQDLGAGGQTRVEPTIR
jgi:hypothetical protein